LRSVRHWWKDQEAQVSISSEVEIVPVDKLEVWGVTRSLFNYLVPMLQDKQAEEEEEEQKERRWACLHRLEKRG
jgi:hypothetical protein